MPPTPTQSAPESFIETVRQQLVLVRRNADREICTCTCGHVHYLHGDDA